MKTRGRLVLLVLAVVTGAASGWLVSRLTDLPHVESLETYHPGELSRIFADDGTVMDELFLEKREEVPLERIPESLRQAVIAVEDSRFYSHHGFDFRGITRALIKNLLAGRIVQGGSTITQQLSKVLFFSPDRTLIRKLKEAILTLQIEKRYTKNQILTLYLNQIYLGAGCYGVQTASRRYFGKDVSDLTLAESALLAALPKSPSKYSPLSNPAEAAKRRNLVLKRMAALHYLSEEDAEHAGGEPLPVRNSRPSGRIAPYFVQEIIRELETRLGRDTLYEGGLSIHTSLDTRMQAIARKAIAAGIQAILARHPENRESPLQAALLAVDPRTGSIKALIGVADFSSSPFNRTTRAERQPGSAFKPILYAAALREGFQATDLLENSPLRYQDPKTGRIWTPDNFSHQFSNPVTLRRALEKSLNIPTVRLLQEVGVGKVVALAKRLGIGSRLSPYPSLALGTSEVTLQELTCAYAVFANGGIYSQPIRILRVYDRKGNLIESHSPATKAVLDRQTAFLITYLLQGVVQSGTGGIARRLNRPVAAKTGTTDDYSDAWFIGYTPNLVTGVWVGYDDRTSIGDGETGARAAGPIWTGFMEEVLRNRPVARFPIPPSIIFRKIDARTGGTVTPMSREVIEEAFRESGRK